MGVAAFTSVKHGLELENVLLRVFGRLLLLALVRDVRLSLGLDLGFLLRRLVGRRIFLALLLSLCESDARGKRRTRLLVRVLFACVAIQGCVLSYPTRRLGLFVRGNCRVLLPVGGLERRTEERLKGS